MSDTQRAIPAGYRFLAMTANYWGMADNTKDALRNIRGAGGSGALSKSGYVMYRVHPDTEINEVDGGFCHPIGEKPIKIEDRRK